jgi:hypothetical protein
VMIHIQGAITLRTAEFSNQQFACDTTSHANTR